MVWTQKSSGWDRKRLADGSDPFQHWYRDNQVYFITARCRDGFKALANEAAKAVFWDRFAHYTSAHEFTPWVASVMDNHYHFVGYCKVGGELRQLMRKLHGSVAKLVNDLLASGGVERLVPFWGGDDGHDYFDGCLRDDQQYLKACRYTLMQAVRAGTVRSWQEYRHTRVFVDMQTGLEFARRNRAFLYGVRYKRYEQNREGHGT
jgi:hypothetical protein